MKTSIAFESLLAGSENEPITRVLSEKSAFILSDNSHISREEISKIIKDFYNVRSGIVHGDKKKLKKLSDSLLEGIDRLTYCLYVTKALFFFVSPFFLRMK